MKRGRPRGRRGVFDTPDPFWDGERLVHRGDSGLERDSGRYEVVGPGTLDLREDGGSHTVTIGDMDGSPGVQGTGDEGPEEWV